MSIKKEIVAVIEKARDQYTRDFPKADNGLYDYEAPPYDFVELIAKELECRQDMARHLNWIANKESDRLTYKPS